MGEDVGVINSINFSSADIAVIIRYRLRQGFVWLSEPDAVKTDLMVEHLMILNAPSHDQVKS